MTPLVVEGVYENGMLKLDKPLPFNDQERVRVTVQLRTTLAEQSAGLMGWKGPVESAEYFATDAELEYPISGKE